MEDVREKAITFFRRPNEFFTNIDNEPFEASARHLGILFIVMVVLEYFFIFESSLSAFMSIAISFNLPFYMGLAIYPLIMFFLTPFIMQLIVVRSMANFRKTLVVYWYAQIYVGLALLPVFYVIQRIPAGIQILPFVSGAASLAILVYLVIGLKNVHKKSIAEIVGSLFAFAVIINVLVGLIKMAMIFGIQ